MNHSIETNKRPDDLAQVRAASIMLSLVSRHADLPALTWSVDPAGHVVGTRTAGPDADVAEDLGAWAGALDVAVTATPHRCDGRIVYRARVDLSGTGRPDPGAGPTPVTITGVGVLARPAPGCTAEYGGPGYTRCELAAGHDGRHHAPLGSMRTATWDTDTAEVLPVGTQPADPCNPADDAPRPHPGWRRVAGDRWERDAIGTVWAVEVLDETEVDPISDPGGGAYLTGPGEWSSGRRVAVVSLAAGLLAADRAIGEWAVAEAVAIGEDAASDEEGRATIREDDPDEGRDLDDEYDDGDA
ncbi:hypothetical protein [Embleya hyalina]|uniref:Uncharacterized protein n=1 Tax=Embleya hyalina TaxID=516124 RepID=A0A401YHE9_9ACTN|nr:hypothetical protein [Embleya hyalina]GCD94044.1 hypothetical protein EHYA_01700 [Embleya hyalina]